MTTHPFDPPVEAGHCRNCGDPLVATGRVTLPPGAYVISGLRDYEWTHAHGAAQCLPKTVAQPYDAWQATAKVETALRVREAAEDALIAAIEGEV